MKAMQKVLGIAALTLCGFTAHAATLSVVPASSTVMQGSTFAVTVAIADLVDGGAPSLADFDIDIDFDANLLGFAGFSWGDALLGDQLDLAHLGSLQLFDDSAAAAGHLNFFEVSYDDSTVLNAQQAGSFGLLTLTFQALAAGVASIDVSANALGNVDGDTVSAQMLGANVRVDQVPLPSALPLFATALLLAGGARSRRHK